MKKISSIYQGIDLDAIQPINRKNDVSLVFQHTINGQVAYRKTLALENLYYFEMRSNIDREYPVAPYYLVELAVEEIDNIETLSEKLKNIASRQGNINRCYCIRTVGDLDICALCENVTEAGRKQVGI